ncbi:MAG: hypothetical protein ACOCZR_04605, partial [Halanaerobiales bacterium]
ADILDVKVEVPEVTEMAALGAAYLAGLGVGYWDSLQEIEKQWKVAKVYEPQMDEARRKELYAGWKKLLKGPKIRQKINMKIPDYFIIMPKPN